jgi:hypothetical protein
MEINGTKLFRQEKEKENLGYVFLRDKWSLGRGKAILFYLVELTKSCMWLYSAC